MSSSSQIQNLIHDPNKRKPISSNNQIVKLVIVLCAIENDETKRKNFTRVLVHTPLPTSFRCFFEPFQIHIIGEFVTCHQRIFDSAINFSISSTNTLILSSFNNSNIAPPWSFLNAVKHNWRC
jgi:hypothetical protein